jgi:hypothetical protein
MGLRLENSSTAPQQVWYRLLANGDVAVGLYNKLGQVRNGSIQWNHLCDQWCVFHSNAAGFLAAFFFGSC